MTYTKSEWESSPWTKEPGENSPALTPTLSGVLKTLPPPHHPTITGPLPSLASDISDLTPIFLEIKSGLMAERWLVWLCAPIVFLMIPATIALSFFAFADPDIPVFLKFFFPVSVALVIWLSVFLFSLTALAYEDEPIRFNRVDRKLYCFRAARRHWPGFGAIPKIGRPEIKTYDWSNVRGEVLRNVVLTGSTARRDSFLFIAIVDPTTGQVTERFRIGDRSVGGLFGTRVALWETIRRFMEDGSNEIPEPVRLEKRQSLVDFIDLANPLRLVWRPNSMPQRLLSILLTISLLPFGPLCVIFSLSKWAAYKSARKVNWGDLEHRTFNISLSKLQRRQPEPHTTTSSKVLLTTLWSGIVFFEIVLFLWFVR